LPLGLVYSKLDSKEETNGNFYSVGDSCIVSTILVFRQYSYEVNPVANPVYFMNFLELCKKIFMK